MKCRGAVGEVAAPVRACDVSGGSYSFLMKTGQNDPCHCGSGRKFKKCHGHAEPAPTDSAPGPQLAQAKFPNWAAFWNDLEPRLKAHLATVRDRDAEYIIRCFTGFAAYYVEDAHQLRTKNHDAAIQLAPLLMQNVDILRGLLAGMEALSVVTLAALARIAFETHVNLRWILSRPSSDVPMFARRFAEFFNVERLVHEHDKYRSKKIRAACLKEIEQKWPDWMDAKGKPIKHWTALQVNGRAMTTSKLCEQIDEAIRAQKKAADPNWKPAPLGPDDLEELGEFESAYNGLYAMTSKPIHASSTIRNLYLTGESFGPLPNAKSCASMALLGASYCQKTLLRFLDFAGIGFDVAQAAGLGDLLDEYAQRNPAKPLPPPPGANAGSPSPTTT